MNIDKKISQLKMALLTKDLIVTISVDEWYSIEYQKNGKTFIVKIDTEEDIKKRAELRADIEELKKQLRKTEKGSIEYSMIKNDIEYLQDEIKGYYAEKFEVFSKVDVLLVLVDKWKSISGVDE